MREQNIKYYYDPDFLSTELGSGFPSAYRDPAQTSYKGVCHKAPA